MKGRKEEEKTDPGLPGCRLESANRSFELDSKRNRTGMELGRQARDGPGS